MFLPMSKERKEEVIQTIRRFFAEKHEIELSELHAAFLVDYFFHEIAPFAYNQGVEDAQKHLIQLAEDLPATCFQEPLTYWDAHDSSHVVRCKPQKT
jgi:uncharacterized protein (DUF2164 family)